MLSSPATTGMAAKLAAAISGIRGIGGQPKTPLFGAGNEGSGNGGNGGGGGSGSPPHFTYRQALAYRFPELPLHLLPFGAALVPAERLSRRQKVSGCSQRGGGFKRNLLHRGAPFGVKGDGSAIAGLPGQAQPQLQLQGREECDAALQGAPGPGDGSALRPLPHPPLLLLPCALLALPLPLPQWAALHHLPGLVRRLEGMLSAAEFRAEVLVKRG